MLDIDADQQPLRRREQQRAQPVEQPSFASPRSCRNSGSSRRQPERDVDIKHPRPTGVF
jgi:hypothetical protein